MSIKITVASKTQFKNGNTDNKLHLKMKGKDINFIIVNTLRRVCLDLIPIHAFDPDDIQIKPNTSVYNNDIIRNRLSTFPLYEINNDITLIDEINNIQNKTIEEDSLDTLQIFFSKKNDTNNIFYLTTAECEFYMGDKKIESIYNSPLLLVPLKPQQEIRGSCKSSIGIGLHSSIYHSVQICCYEEINDNEFLFKLESRGQLSEKDILKRACLVVEKKMSILYKRFEDQTINGNKLELTLQNEDHTFGNLITYFLQENKYITHAGYKVDHPANREVDIQLESNGSKKMKTIMLETFTNISDLFKKIRSLIK
jgi:DNA-directed RNA polymerase subunit L